MQTQAMLQQAAALLQAGRTREGELLCRQVLAQLPGQPDALHFLAMAARDRNCREEAEQLFRQSLSQAPRRPDILVNYGNFLRFGGRLGEARTKLRKAIKLAPDFVPGWYNLGLLLYGEKDLAEARRCAHKVTRLAPKYAAGWELLAAVEQKGARPDAAIKACRTGLRHCPEAPRLHYSLGQLLREECEFSAAAAAYESALQRGHANADVYRNLAESYLEAGQTNKAMEAINRGIGQLPEDAQMQRLRARLHWELGAPGDPLDSIREAAQANPHNPALWQVLVELLNRLKRYDESREALDQARALQCPQSPDLLRLAALNHVHSGEPDEATAHFSQILEAFPDHPGINLTFAQHLLSTGDPARAESLCSAVLKNNPRDQLALAYLGTALQLQHDPRESWLMDYQKMVQPLALEAPSGYASREEFFTEVQRLLESMHRTEAHPIDQTLRGGTQTNGHLFRLKHPLIQQLETQIREAITAVLGGFPRDSEHPFWQHCPRKPGPDSIRFSGAWSVRLKSEGFHTNHIHPEGWMSSALYIALPDEVKAANDEAGYIQFGVPTLEIPLDLEPRRVVRPEVGSLVLFPSYMWHGTVPFQSEQPRITVAFDIIPRR